MAANKNNPGTPPRQIADRLARAESITAGRRVRRRPGLHAVVSAAVVLGSHAGVLYVLAHEVEPVLPSVSVPIIISLATAAKPMQAKPKAAPPKVRPKPKRKPKPRQAPVVAKAPGPAPVPPEPPEETDPVPVEPLPPQVVAPPAPAPPQVIPPRFDAAYLNNPVPAYPPLSRRLGEEGRVVLRVFVAPDGTAAEVEVSDSSGSPRLDRAALQAVERWKFSPARRGNTPTGAWVLVPINFSLARQG